MGIRAKLYKAYAGLEGERKALPFILKLLGLDAEFVESDHPRDENGRFASGGGSGSSEKLKESSTEFNSEPEDISLEDLFADLWNEAENPKSPEEIKRENRERAEREAEERQKEDFGQNGLSEKEYPEELRLTDEEREAVFDVLHGYRDYSHKTKAGRDIMDALSGLANRKVLEEREKAYTKELEEANEMIAQRKEEGYKGKKSTYADKKAWWAYYNEHGEAPPMAVGESGIKHWQSQRKRALENIRELGLAQKIVKRNEFAEKSQNYMPWRKNPNAGNEWYKPWEAHDSLMGEDGGKGSGNWGHRGRPGKRGGSGKGGGKALRSGNSESGYKSFAKTPEFTQLANIARLHQGGSEVTKKSNRREFWNAVKSKPELDNALKEQHNAVSPDESYSDYVDRMYDMLSERIADEKTDPKVEEIMKSFNAGYTPIREMTDEQLTMSRICQRYGISPSKIVNNRFSTKDKTDFLRMVGDRMNWGKRLIDRSFKHLSEQEKADMNALLDKYPWSDDPMHAGIPNEKDLYETESEDVQDYYNALKAKAMGIGGVYVPDRPEELDEKSPIDGWQDDLSDRDKRFVNEVLDNGKKSLTDYINSQNADSDFGSVNTTKRLLRIVGQKAGWDEQFKERSFDRLSESEKQDINLIMDQFPWVEGSQFEKYANEDFIYDEGCWTVRQYYSTLKAKAMGIPGVKVPERPKELEYIMKYGTADQEMKTKEPGYVHTEVGNKHREAIKEQLRNPQIMNKMFAGDTAAQYRDKIIESIDGLDDDIAEVVSRSIGKAKIDWVNGNGTSNYSFDGTITIYTQMSDGEMRSQEEVLGTFWHEYGHFAEQRISNSGVVAMKNPIKSGLYSHSEMQGPTSITKTNDEYTKATKKDVQALLEATGLDKDYHIVNDDYEKRVKIARNSDNVVIEPMSSATFSDENKIQDAINEHIKKLLGYDEIRMFMQKHGEPETVDWDDYFETYTTPKRHLVRTRERFKGAQEAYQKAVLDRSEAYDKWIESIGGRDAYFALADEKAEMEKEYERKKSLCGYITDSLDESVYGLFGMVIYAGGHESRYYKSKSTIETTANIFAARAINNPDINAFMEKLIPNTVALHTQAWRMRRHEV